MVAGFHCLETGLSVGEELLERRERGMRDVQKVGWATRGRLDSWASLVMEVAEKGRDGICRLAHETHRFCKRYIALEGAMLVMC